LSTLRTASKISLLTMVSRALGFLRDILMLRMLGATGAGTFLFAWLLPNMFRRLFGEGALTTAFIPAFTSALRDPDRGSARHLLASVSGILLLGLSALTAVALSCWLLLPVDWFSGRGEAADNGALFLDLAAILFPYVILICLIGIYSGALHSLSVFAIPATLPIVLNVFWIAGLLIASVVRANDGPGTSIWLAGFLLAGGFCQLSIVAITLWQRGYLARPRLPQKGDPAWGVFVIMLPTLLSMSLVQINSLVDQSIAFFVIAPEANSHVFLANRLLLFPHAITSLALATAAFPKMVVLGSNAQNDDLRHKVNDTIGLTLWLTVPASIGLILVSSEFIDLFFAHGQFTDEDARWSSLTTATLVAGLPFIGAGQLYVRAMISLSDRRTPAILAAWMVPLNLLLSLGFVLGLGMGVPGLTLGSSVCALLNVILLKRSFHALCPGKSIGLKSLAHIALATTAMALVVYATGNIFSAESDLQRGLLRVGLPITVGIACYAGVMWMVGDPTIRRLWRPIGALWKKTP